MIKFHRNSNEKCVVSLCFCSLVAKLRASVAHSLLVGDNLQLLPFWGSVQRTCTESANKTSGQKTSHYVQFQTKK